MILWGLTDSPFTRRVALALAHYRIHYEHRPLSVLDDFEELQGTNPLGRAPALTLADGRVLTDSRTILEWIELSHTGPGLTAEAADLFDMLAIEAMALGLADKAVALSAELRRDVEDDAALARILGQIEKSLDWLESRAHGGWLCGPHMTRADLALACATTYLVERHPDAGAGERAGLEAHRAFCEGQTPFSQIPFPHGPDRHGTPEDRT